MEEAISSSAVEAALAPPAIAQDGHEAEEKLSAESLTLWSAHNLAQAAAKQSKEELQAIRLELGRRLSEVKERVSRPGRGGGFSAYVSAHGIPRATAQGLIARYRRSQEPQGNSLSDPISGSAKAGAAKLFETVWPRLKKILATDESVIEFVGCIATASGLAHDQREEGLMILNPVSKAADELPGSTITSPPTGQAQQNRDAASNITEEPATEAAMPIPATEQVAGHGDDCAGAVA